MAPLDQVEIDSPAGTCFALLIQEGGNVAAYGRNSSSQPTSLRGMKVNVPSKSWLVVDIDAVIIPSAAVIFHILPQPATTSSQKTKAGAYTLDLQEEGRCFARQKRVLSSDYIDTHIN